MKWVSHREYKATIRALEIRIDALEAQCALHHDALDTIEYVNFSAFEVLAGRPRKPEFSTQGNVIVADFGWKSD